MNDSEILAGEHVKKKPWSLRRKPFPWFIYIVIGILAAIYAVLILQWSLYPDGNATDSALNFMQNLWAETPSYQFITNFLVWLLVFATLTFLFNRFWISTPVFVLFVTLLAVAQRMKVIARAEVITPADLMFLNNNAGEISSFMPTLEQRTIIILLSIALLAVLVSVGFFLLDGRRGLIKFNKVALTIPVRLLLILIPALVLSLFSLNISNPDSISSKISKKFSDNPLLWNSLDDAKTNGTTLSFLHLLNPKVMDKPTGYNENTMKEIAQRYHDEAKQINTSRSNNLTDDTVIYVLSESFSDPTRVPGLKFNQDPMSHIRSIKSQTTSGLMLSPGYGGGTANIEYEALSGLSLTNFDSTLTTPYQQLVPQQANPFSINQLWNTANGSSSSIAIHPFNPAMYFRSANYKKFGFSKFWSYNPPNIMVNQDRIDSSGYVSDKASYKEVLDNLGDKASGQFIQLVTMQNHLPYPDWYGNNQYVAESTDTRIIDDEKQKEYRTYAKGVEYTDKATNSFLQELNKIDSPITVVFYGDHLPGIYDTSNRSDAELTALHETDYFIWSNSSSQTSGERLSNNISSLTSPNFFPALLAEHTNSQVSPYLAFLDKLHQKIPAMETLALSAQNNGQERNSTYLNPNGESIPDSAISTETEKLLHDYKLIQYDLTVGSNYLKDFGFMNLP